MTITLFEKQSVICEKHFPCLHPNINLNHLYENNKILTDKEITNLTIEFNKQTYFYNRKKIKSQNGENYAIIRLGDENKGPLYAIYHGIKSDSTLGVGAFSKVKLMQNLETGEWHALKIINNPNNHAYKLCQNEIDVLKDLKLYVGEMVRLKKVNAQKLIGLKLIPGMNLSQFNNDQHVPTYHWLVIVTNLCKTIKNFIDLGYLHCDIKPNNLMINPVTYDVSLIDFLLSMKGEEFIKKHKRGTYNFMSWNFKNNKWLHNEKTEIASLGKTIGYLLDLTTNVTGMFTISKPNAYELTYNQKVPDKTLRDTIILFLKRMTTHDLNKRPNLIEVLEFFTNLQNKHQEKTNCERKIGILNINDYLTTSDSHKKEICNYLSAMDEVWFSDICERPVKTYYALQKELRLYHIKIGEKLLINKLGQSSTNYILNHVSQLAINDKTWKKKYFYITKQSINSLMHTTPTATKDASYDLENRSCKIT